MAETIFKQEIIALIPARSGSERIPKKNIKMLNGHPLIAYTIAQARRSHIFSRIFVTSNSREILDIAERYGKGDIYPIECPLEVAHKSGDEDRKWIDHACNFILEQFPVSDPLNSDEDWINNTLNHSEKFYRKYDAYAILRPTNPFRAPLSIALAWGKMIDAWEDFDSLKAYVPCRTNPYKIFEIMKYDNAREYMQPIFTDIEKAFTMPTQAFQHRKFGDQVGFLDICKWDNIPKHDNHFGEVILPYPVDTVEAWDLNTELDWFIAEKLIEGGRAKCSLYE